jgi:hypothetical protein
MVCARVIPVQFALSGVRGSSRHSGDDWESDVAANKGSRFGVRLSMIGFCGSFSIYVWRGTLARLLQMLLVGAAADRAASVYERGEGCCHLCAKKSLTANLNSL